jgi:hypothetical protein
MLPTIDSEPTPGKWNTNMQNQFDVAQINEVHRI